MLIMLTIAPPPQLLNYIGSYVVEPAVRNVQTLYQEPDIILHIITHTIIVELCYYYYMINSLISFISFIIIISSSSSSTLCYTMSYNITLFCVTSIPYHACAARSSRRCVCVYIHIYIYIYIYICIYIYIYIYTY